ncbi:hypothetical protein P0052_001251 [Enterococcus faecium]|nr:hypothetical protein [Enterococcus faecium]
MIGDKKANFFAFLSDNRKDKKDGGCLTDVVFLVFSSKQSMIELEGKE